MPPKRPPKPPAPPPATRAGARAEPKPAPKAAPETANHPGKAARPAYKPGADEPLSLFAVTAPGLEPLAAQELTALGLEAKAIVGGAAFKGQRADVYRANLWLRTASRVLVRAGGTYAATFSELRSKAARLPWERFLKPGQPVSIRATSHKSKLYHTDAVAERVAGAIGDALGQAPTMLRAATAEADEGNAAGGEPAAELAHTQLVVVRLVDDRCTISIDSSGALLHQRGYRLATGKAPLRESLAAGLVLAARWDRTSPFIDPFCGAGTLVIEAARLALNMAPGLDRRFAFMDWPDFDAAVWQAQVSAAAEAKTTGAAPLLYGYDRDAGAVAAAQANAERAGVSAAVHFAQQTISALRAPEGRGWLVTNPPYGVRVTGGADLRDLYAQFGQVLRAQCPGWQVGFLSADAQLARETGLRFDLGRTVDLMNGGLPVQFVQARVSAPPAA